MSILQNGFPSLEEIRAANGWPSEERFAKGPVAIAECVQEIPCNPCEAACPMHAITFPFLPKSTKEKGASPEAKEKDRMLQ